MEVGTVTLPAPHDLHLGCSQFTLKSPAAEVSETMEQGSGEKTNEAAVKLQKVYKSYRTRRRLADSAVVAEELWWQAIDFARLNYSTVSFFNFNKHETAVSRWSRVSLNASKVGKGLSEDEKALQLAFWHWIEAIDPRHRYGHSLHYYYDEWCKSNSGQPFFFWLDIGDGQDVDLQECPRSKLRKHCIKYLGPKERMHYEYVPVDGKIVHKQTGELLDTSKEPEEVKWIFVMSTSKSIYAGRKEKGKFHHSSFLAGGTTLAAGRIKTENGVLKYICDCSGHYLPSDKNLNVFITFLRENGVNPDEIEIHDCSSTDEESQEESGRATKKKIKRDKTRLDETETEAPPDQTVVLQSETSKVDKERESHYISGCLLNLDLEVASAPEETQSVVSDERGTEGFKPIAQLEGHESETQISKAQAQPPPDLTLVIQPETPRIGEARENSYKRTLSGGLQSPKPDVPQKAILQRINSKKAARSYQLGNQLSLKWTTGLGPRIGCVADYPLELRIQALEYVSLSPKGSQTPSPSRSTVSCSSPLGSVAHSCGQYNN
ncbi:IQ domain-containing protein IQM3 [Amborella trichopoda]|uniref:Uncharacterized protein n=1 Tax=Amborella trichopoda TaxID=13333 RepID=W1PYR0_AMBTC|nr:IQ domain-containing protein IQM3 [Amborella trichopoda]ERN13126.1 hypothetical protein AMTR_s00040p00177440 [Amborella trichopoda]|eukprot:XP_006851545.1 IQ domain-containing protein IQM3 [Amborella trichopoda]